MAETGTDMEPLWTIAAAAVPAFVTLVGTVWQLHARRPKNQERWTRTAGVFGSSVRALRLDTHRPPTTVEPGFARTMVIWHALVAATLLLIWLQPFGALPFAKLAILIPLAILYVLGAVLYAWKYYKYRGVDLKPRAELLVEGNAQDAFELCRALLATSGTDVVSLEAHERSRARVEGRTGGARLLVTLAPVDRHDANSDDATGDGACKRFALHVEGIPCRGIDGLLRAQQLVDGFARGLLTSASRSQ